TAISRFIEQFDMGGGETYVAEYRDAAFAVVESRSYVQDLGEREMVFGRVKVTRVTSNLDVNWSETASTTYVEQVSFPWAAEYTGVTEYTSSSFSVVKSRSLLQRISVALNIWGVAIYEGTQIY